MKIARTLCTLLAALVLLAAGSPAAATTVTDCLGLIGTLSDETTQVWYTNARDERGLLAKLAGAAAKLDTLKLNDAVQKLGDYESKVDALIAAGKIGPSGDGATTPEMLVDGADEAIACIRNIGS